MGSNGGKSCGEYNNFLLAAALRRWVRIDDRRSGTAKSRQVSSSQPQAPTRAHGEPHPSNLLSTSCIFPSAPRLLRSCALSVEAHWLRLIIPETQSSEFYPLVRIQYTSPLLFVSHPRIRPPCLRLIRNPHPFRITSCSVFLIPSLAP